MNAYLALSVCVFFIMWLYIRDRKLRPMTSGFLWIPLLWIINIGSRSSPYWSMPEIDPSMLYESSLEGSPLDRNIFLILIIGGMFALWKRRLNWSNLFTSNPWLFAFLLYCGVSVIWSDYPFVSLKKWIKDMGNVVMILIILTESNPVLAVKAVFARYVYLVVPLSVVLIMYFPELGTYSVSSFSSPDTIAYSGVTTHKNSLGAILVISGLFLVWDLIERRFVGNSKIDLALRSVLLVMVIWLLIVADSATALVSITIGITILLFVRIPLIQRQIQHIGVYSLLAAFFIFFLISYPAITEMFFKLVGREATFTGRTEIWEGLLKESINPLFGTGFQSFWIRPGMMEKYDYINESHNGYLETYLNGGLIGLGLLMAVIVSAFSKLKKGLLQGVSLAPLLFSFFIVNIYSNLTESVFNRLSLTWFVFLIASLNYSQRIAPVTEKVAFNLSPTARPVFAPVVLK